VGYQEGEEVDGGEELVIGAEPGVEPRPLVVNQAIVSAVREAAERYGGPLDVGEEALESLAVVDLNFPLPSNGEARMLPRPHSLHGLGPHLFAAEHHAEEALAEDLLESGEVEVFQGEEDAVGAEESEGTNCVAVGIVHDQVPERLRGGDHGGYGADFPAPVLSTCTEPLADGAPDMRGMWHAVAAERNGAPVPEGDKVYDHFQRIEQCGDRVTITAGGIIHDMRADGTEEHGVHDVAEMDYTTPITVVATFEDGVHVLRPVGVPIEVTRRLDGDQLVWSYLGTTVTLERIGGPDAPPPNT